MLNIELNVDALSTQLSGIGRYTLELMHGLRRHSDINNFRTYYQTHIIDNAEQLLLARPKYKRKKFSRWLARGHQLERRLLPGKWLFHGPNYMLPREIKRGIITVHDLSVFKYPEAHPTERLAHFDREFTDSIRRAVHIITDTDTIKTELMEFLNLSSHMVTAVPLGVSSKYRPDRRYGGASFYESHNLIAGSYILLVATMEPRKRIEIALEAYYALPNLIKNHYPLVLAGATGWENHALHRLIEQEATKGHLRILGFVPEAQLPALYAGARLFLFPSIYEGFGLPPIEAMASGVPTLVSNCSCLPEICQGAAELIEAENIGAWTEAIERALSDDAWWQVARDNGLNVASGYSWEKTISQTVAVYQRVAEQL